MNRKPRNNFQTVLLAGLALLLGSFLLRLYRITQGLTYDEIFSFLEFIRLPYGRIVRHFPQPNNHILYTLLAHASILKFGVHEWSLRLPSLVLGSLVPPVYYLLWRKRLGQFVAVIAGLFMALNYWQVWFSQDTRGYAGLILFAGLSQAMYLEWRESGSLRSLAIYLAANLIANYFHLYMTVVIVGQIAFGFYLLATQIFPRPGRKPAPAPSPRPAEKIPAKKAKKKKPAPVSTAKPPAPWSWFAVPVISLGLVLLPYLPVFSQILLYFNRSSHNLKDRWLGMDFLVQLIQLWSGVHVTAWGILLLVLAGIGIIRLAKDWPELFWLYLLPTAFLILSTLILHTFIYARFLAFDLPFIALGMAAGLEWIARRTASGFPALKQNYLRGLLLTLVALLLAASLVRYYQVGKSGAKKAFAYIQQNYRGQSVVTYGLSASYFQIYRPQIEVFTPNMRLTPEKVSGKVLVASYRYSWTEHNRQVMYQSCHQVKTWPSIEMEDATVYLFQCF